MLKSTGKTGFARLWELTAAEKPLVIISGVLSVAGVAASFLPYVAIYMIISHIVAAGGDVALTDKGTLLRYGLIALLSAAGAFIINLAGLIFSHAAAFNTLYRLRVGFVKHLAALPMGFHTRHPSGKLRKIMDENIEKLEGFIAHQLPDMIGTAAAPVIILIMLFAFDWRFGLAALVPVVLSYVILFSSFMGTEAAENLRKYQDALEDMNDSAVEYVRGMSVVKAFGQSVFSFRKFYNLIRTYTEFCINYTNIFRNRMAGFLTIINNVYLFIMPLSIILLSGSSNYAETALASIFYIIFSLSLPASFTKIMYVTNKGRIIADGIERMDKLLNTPPLPAPAYLQVNRGCDVEFDNVSFEYHGESGDVLALKNISFTARQGELTALVGPSGSGKSTLTRLIARFWDVNSGSLIWAAGM